MGAATQRDLLGPLFDRAVYHQTLQRVADPWDGKYGSARPAQLAPDGDWGVWLIMAGRGFGKSRSGAEWVRQRVQTGKAKRITLAGPTASDVRDIMVEGESGLLAVCDGAGVDYLYQPSKRRIEFPKHHAAVLLVSSDRPDRYRGLQHDTVWADEIASWRYGDDAWTQMMLGLRLGDDPRAVATTTPRPIKFIRQLIADPGTVITRGTTYENFANLADRFKETVITRYEGTSIGRQELMGELIEDVEGALWKRSMIDNHRASLLQMPEMKTISVAVDPATTHGEDSDETGLAVAGLGTDGEYYALHISGHRLSPNDWAMKALSLYDTHQANEIVAESNQGGEMVRQTILNACRDRSIKPRIRLIHASRGKVVRAEPVVALYEQGKVHHVGQFATAEDQMTVFPVSNDHDDQVDALVHAITALGVGTPARMRSF